MRRHAQIVARLLVLACIFDCQCHSDKLAIQPPIQVAADGGSSGDPCALACAKLCANGCPAGCNPACEDVCRRDQAQRAASQLDPACIINATTVPQIVACGATCSQ